MFFRSIISLGLLILTAFVSYKIAEEKEMHKTIWSIVAVLFGPIGIVIQYIYWMYSKKLI